MTIFTIGYGGRTMDEFLSLLNANKIKRVVDIRLRPDRASMGIWIKAKTKEKGIEKWLNDAGIEYQSLIELGNVFLDFPDWKKRYRELLSTSGKLLTERLFDVPTPFCLLCAEKKACDCHRLEVGKYLKDNFGADIVHLE